METPSAFGNIFKLKEFPSSPLKSRPRERQKSLAPEIQKSECSTPKFSLSSISLYSDIEATLRKLDPSFQLFLTNQSPVSQILQCVRQATHFLQTQQKRLSKEDSCPDNDFSKSLPCEHCGKYSKNIRSETVLLTQRLEKLKQKSKKFDKQKIIHSEKIKEEKKLLNVFKEKLEGLAERLTSQKQEILTEEKEVRTSKFLIESLENISFKPYLTSQKPPERKFEIQNFPCLSIESQIDFSIVIEKLESHIQVYNDEIAEREKQLNDREKGIKLREENFKKYVSDIELISLTLNNSKKDCYDLKQKLFPKIEVEMEMIKQILEEINGRKQEIEEILDNFEELVQENRPWAEFSYLRSETQKKYKENCEYNDYLMDLQEKLDSYYAEKDKEIKENGERLIKLQESVNSTIETMERKEKELLRLGERLKFKEQTMLTRTKSMKETSEEPNQDQAKTPKYTGSNQHSRYFKSMQSLKSLIEDPNNVI